MVTDEGCALLRRHNRRLGLQLGLVWFALSERRCACRNVSTLPSFTVSHHNCTLTSVLTAHYCLPYVHSQAQSRANSLGGERQVYSSSVTAVGCLHHVRCTGVQRLESARAAGCSK